VGATPQTIHFLTVLFTCNICLVDSLPLSRTVKSYKASKVDDARKMQHISPYRGSASKVLPPYAIYFRKVRRADVKL